MALVRHSLRAASKGMQAAEYSNSNLFGFHRAKPFHYRLKIYIFDMIYEEDKIQDTTDNIPLQMLCSHRLFIHEPIKKCALTFLLRTAVCAFPWLLHPKCLNASGVSEIKK